MLGPVRLGLRREERAVRIVAPCHKSTMHAYGVHEAAFQLVALQDELPAEVEGRCKSLKVVGGQSGCALDPRLCELENEIAS